MRSQSPWLLIPGLAMVALPPTIALVQAASPVSQPTAQTYQYARIPGVDSNLLSLDVYAPPKAKNAPVMIFIHGGGWQLGDKVSGAQAKPMAFTQAGYVFVSINYRLSPAIQHPVHVQDVARAIAWVRQHIQSKGGNPAQLFVMGHSAGAHLAALIATDDRRLQQEGLKLSHLKGVILLDGAGYNLPKTLAVRTTSRIQAMYFQAFSQNPDTWKDASPIYHVSAGKNIPPFLIFHVPNRPIAKQQSEELATALRQAGTPAQVVVAANKTHATLNHDLGKSGDRPTEQVFQFLQKLNP